MGSVKPAGRRTTYGNLSGYNDHYPMPNLSKKGNKTVEDDGNSTDDILSSHGAAIVRTTEVEVKYNQTWADGPRDQVTREAI